MNAHRTRPASFPWPPVLMLAACAASVVLGWSVPLHLGFYLSWLVGTVLLACAVAIDLWAMKTLHDGRTTVLPHRATSHLVTGGPFRLSRNPIYVAYGLILLGLGLVTTNAWFAIAAPVHLLATYLLAIRGEERHLLALFGYRYETYCRQVRRWI